MVAALGASGIAWRNKTVSIKHMHPWMGYYKFINVTILQSIQLKIRRFFNLFENLDKEC